MLSNLRKFQIISRVAFVKCKIIIAFPGLNIFTDVTFTQKDWHSKIWLKSILEMDLAFVK